MLGETAKLISTVKQLIHTPISFSRIMRGSITVHQKRKIYPCKKLENVM